MRYGLGLAALGTGEACFLSPAAILAMIGKHPRPSLPILAQLMAGMIARPGPVGKLFHTCDHL